MPRLKRLADEPDKSDDAAGSGQNSPEAEALARLRDIGARMEAEVAAASSSGGVGDAMADPETGEDHRSGFSTTEDGTGDDGARSPSTGGPFSVTVPSVAGGDAEPKAAGQREHVRILEAMLFAAAEPLDEASLAMHLKGTYDLKALLAGLQAEYATRGVNLVRVSGKWAFRTAEDLSWLLEKHALEEKRLSRAALETLSIIAYHQPVTRAEIEEIRGVTTSKGTLDVLLETGWIRPRGRRRAPGKPLTFGTTPAFLEHFGLDSVGDLPGLTELKAAGLLDGNLPPDFRVPAPKDVAALMPDELPLEAGEDEEAAQAELELEEPLAEDDQAGSRPAEAGDAGGRDDRGDRGEPQS
jgi:segregation and condensation protein B